MQKINNLTSTEMLLMEKYGKSALTINEVAEELEVDVKDINDLISRGQIAVKRIGNKDRVMIQSLAFYIGSPTTVASLNEQEKHLVTDILHRVLEEKKKTCKKLSSYSWYCYQGKHIEKFFQNIYVEDVDKQMLINFLNSITKNKNGKQMSQRFVQAVTCLFKNIIDLAIQEEFIGKNPFKAIRKLPKGYKTNSRNRVLSKKTVLKLMEVLDSSPTYKPMITLMLRSGLRIGEVLALRWSDIDEESGIIHVEQGLSVEYDEDENGNLINKRYEIGDTKTVCSVRDIPVDKKVFDVLNEWRRHIESKPKLKAHIVEKGNQDIIFVNRVGDLRSYQSLRKAFKRFLVDNNLGNVPITFHRFRHTYATMLLDAGVDIDIIRDLLGHSDIQTTANIYVKVNMEPKKRATKKFEESLNKLLGSD